MGEQALHVLARASRYRALHPTLQLPSQPSRLENRSGVDCWQRGVGEATHARRSLWPSLGSVLQQEWALPSRSRERSHREEQREWRLPHGALGQQLLELHGWRHGTKFSKEG